MYLKQATYNNLEDLSHSFDNNFSITIDFLFFVFDSYTFEEKQNMLKHFPIGTKSKKEEETKKTDEKKIHIKINKLLEERLNNLCTECEKLFTPSNSIEFLLFVLQMVQKEILSDLILQYTMESQDYEGNETYFENKIDIDSENPIHVDPDFHSDSEPYSRSELC